MRRLHWRWFWQCDDEGLALEVVTPLLAFGVWCGYRYYDAYWHAFKTGWKIAIAVPEWYRSIGKEEFFQWQNHDIKIGGVQNANT